MDPANEEVAREGKPVADGDAPAAPEDPAAVPADGERPVPARARKGALTPRQARRMHTCISAFLIVGLAAGLAARLAQQASVLVVGVYGFALILCGVVVELSRRGRTRLGMWLMITGVLVAALGDTLLHRH